LGVGLTTLPSRKENVEKPPRNSVGFCGGGQGLSWAVEPRKEEEQLEKEFRYEIKFRVEDGVSLVFRNVGTQPPHYTVQRHRKPRISSTPPRKPHASRERFVLVTLSSNMLK
jgi:hypothetical protein